MIAISLLFAIIVLAIFFPPRIYNDTGRLLLRMIVGVFGGRVRAEGLKQIDRQKTYIFMSNHVSLFDVALLGGYIPNYARGVVALEQFKMPVIGWFLKVIGSIPIDRSSAHNSWASLERAAMEMKGGKSIFILPEGTRTLSGQLQAFKKLPFRLAKMAEVDIVPIGLSGLFRFKRRNSWIVRPGPIKIKIGELIPFKNIEKMSIETLRELVKSRVAELIEFP